MRYVSNGYRKTKVNEEPNAEGTRMKWENFRLPATQKGELFGGFSCTNLEFTHVGKNLITILRNHASVPSLVLNIILGSGALNKN